MKNDPKEKKCIHELKKYLADRHKNFISADRGSLQDFLDEIQQHQGAFAGQEYHRILQEFFQNLLDADLLSNNTMADVRGPTGQTRSPVERGNKCQQRQPRNSRKGNKTHRLRYAAALIVLAIVSVSMIIAYLFFSPYKPLAFVMKNANLLVVGSVRNQSGSVTARIEDSERPLTSGQSIYLGDLIKTKNNGSATIKLDNGGLVYLDRETELSVREYVKSEQKDFEKVLLDLVRGSLMVASNMYVHSPNNSFRVQTKVATLGLRGTEIWAQIFIDKYQRYDPDASVLTVLCLEPVCEVKNDQGVRIISNANQFMQISPRQQALPLPRTAPWEIMNKAKRTRQVAMRSKIVVDDGLDETSRMTNNNPGTETFKKWVLGSFLLFFIVFIVISYISEKKRRS